MRFQTWCPSGCWSECGSLGHAGRAWEDRGSLAGILGRAGCRERGVDLGLRLDGPQGQDPQWLSLPSVQYNKFTAAGAQQLAAGLRKCPQVKTLA